MPVPEISPRWNYNLLAASANMRGSRTATPGTDACRLIGVDGNSEGGLRPYPGFRRVVDLEYGYGDDAGLTADGGLNAGGEMLDIYSITFRIDDSNYAYGFIYRVLSDDETKVCYHLKFRVGQSFVWHTTPSLGFNEGIIGPEAYGGEQFQVETVGRFVYGFRAGLRPFMFYVTEPTPGTLALNVVDETGPGPSPLLENPPQNSASVHITSDGTLTDNEDVTDILPAFSVPTTRDAEAKVLYFGFSGVAPVSVDNINFVTNPNIIPRNLHAIAQVDTNIPGPSDLGLWVTPPQPDPTFADVALFQSGAPAPSSGVPPWQYPTPYWERNGWGLNLGAKQAGEPVALTEDGSTQVWAYRLYDTRTGRYSALSDRISTRQDGHGIGSIEERIVVDTGVVVSGFREVTFPMIYVIYDKTKYDTMLLYRGQTVSGTTIEETALFQDSNIVLADYHIDSQPVDPEWGVAAYFAALTDEELSLQQTFNGDDSYLEEMPYAGAAIYYEGLMLLGNMTQIDDSIGGSGKFVWSDLASISPELVPATNRYPLDDPSEEIIKFCKINPNVVAFSKDSQYLVRREINYMKAQQMHGGFGLPSHKLATAIASDCYFITPHGMYVVGSNGKLSDLNVINHLLMDEWADEVESLQIAWDQAQSCIYILNPEKERMVLLWMRTDRVTELVDCPFIHIMEGRIPFAADETSLQKRMMVVQEIEDMDVSTPTYGWRILTPDYARSRSFNKMLDPTSLRAHTLLEANDSPDEDLIIIDDDGATDTAALNSHGMYLYVLTGEHVGKKIKVRYTQDSVTYVVEPPGFVLEAGTRLSISPVYMEWIGSQLGVQSEDGTDFGGKDFFAGRMVDALKAAFTDVSYSGLDAELIYQAAIYEGDSDTPLATALVLDTDGQPVTSIKNGPPTDAAAFGVSTETRGYAKTGVHSNALFPAVRVFTTGADFRLLAVRVLGSLRDDDSLRMHS